jgi:hypothetical protein
VLLVKVAPFFLKIIAESLGGFNFFLYLCGGGRGYTASSEHRHLESLKDFLTQNFWKNLWWFGNYFVPLPLLRDKKTKCLTSKRKEYEIRNICRKV